MASRIVAILIAPPNAVSYINEAQERLLKGIRMIKINHWFWLSAGFTVFALMSASAWLMASGGEFGVEALLRVYIPEIIFWNVWILIAPAIFWVARRCAFSITPFSWKWIVHIPLALVFSAGTYVIYFLFLSMHLYLCSLIGLLEEGTLIQEIQYRIQGLMGVGIPLGTMFYGLLVVLSHVQNYYRRLQEEEHRSAVLTGQLAQAELQALRMQLHPHFLFNSLNTISSTLQTDTTAADKMLAELGDFLRITLDNADRSQVSLREELAFIRKYLQIEQHRFEDRLVIEFDIAASVEQAAVPYLIMQPLVENAIRHGVGQSLDTSIIKISAWEEHDQLVIALYNSGAHIEETPSGIRNGVGLSNTRARLQQLYGEKGMLQVQNVKEGGVQSRVQLPLTRYRSPILVEAS